MGGHGAPANERASVMPPLNHRATSRLYSFQATVEKALAVAVLTRGRAFPPSHSVPRHACDADAEQSKGGGFGSGNIRGGIDHGMRPGVHDSSGGYIETARGVTRVIRVTWGRGFRPGRCPHAGDQIF